METPSHDNTTLHTYKIRAWDELPSGLWLCFDADDRLKDYLVSPPINLTVVLPEDEAAARTSLWEEWKMLHAKQQGVHPSVIEAKWVSQRHGSWSDMAPEDQEHLLEDLERAIMAHTVKKHH